MLSRGSLNIEHWALGIGRGTAFPIRHFPFASRFLGRPGGPRERKPMARAMGEGWEGNPSPGGAVRVGRVGVGLGHPGAIGPGLGVSDRPSGDSKSARFMGGALVKKDLLTGLEPGRMECGSKPPPRAPCRLGTGARSAPRTLCVLGRRWGGLAAFPPHSIGGTVHGKQPCHE